MQTFFTRVQHLWVVCVCLTGVLHATYKPHVCNDTLWYYVATPPTRKPYRIVILFSGSAPVSTKNVFLEFRYSVTEMLGAALLCVEKPGISGDGIVNTDVYHRENTVHARVRTACMVLEHLRTTLQGWNGEVVAMGASEGGLVAALFAQVYPVRALVALACGTTKTVEEVVAPTLVETLTQQSRVARLIPTYMLKTLTHWYTSRLFKRVEQRPDSEELVLGYSHIWWSAIKSYREADILSELPCPIFLGVGERDVQSEFIQPYLAMRGKKNVTQRVFKDLDHTFCDSRGVSYRMHVMQQALCWLADTLDT